MKHRATSVGVDIFVLMGVLGLSLVMGHTLHRRAVQIAALRRDRDQLRAALAALRTEQTRLRREREALLTDPVYIEKEARELLGLRREGETLLPPPDPIRTLPGPAVTPETVRGLDRVFVHELFPAVFPLVATLFTGLVLLVARVAARVSTVQDVPDPGEVQPSAARPAVLGGTHGTDTSGSDD